MAAPVSPLLRNAPNALTTLRVLAVPAFVAAMVVEGGPSPVAGAVFLAAALTDFLDGFIARRLHVMSQYGKLLDPLADRLLVNSAVLLLCAYDSRWFGGDGRLLGPEFLLVCTRDALAAYGFWRVRDRAIPDVSRLGKWGMALMMAGLAWLLLLPDASWPVWPFEIGLLVSLLVLGQYALRYRPLLAREPAPDPLDAAPRPRVD